MNLNILKIVLLLVLALISSVWVLYDLYIFINTISGMSVNGVEVYDKLQTILVELSKNLVSLNTGISFSYSGGLLMFCTFLGWNVHFKIENIIQKISASVAVICVLIIFINVSI